MIVAVQQPAAAVRVGNKGSAAGSGRTAGVRGHSQSAALNVARGKASATRRAQAILPGIRFTTPRRDLPRQHAPLTAGKLAVLALLLLLLQKLLTLLQSLLALLLQGLLTLLLQGLLTLLQGLLLLLLLHLRALLNRLLRSGGCGTQNRLYGQRLHRQGTQGFLRACRRSGRQKDA